MFCHWIAGRSLGDGFRALMPRGYTRRPATEKTSFYTASKDEPDDIDILVVLRDNLDLTQELQPNQERVIDKKTVRREYKFDAFSYKDGEKGLLDLIALFSG